MKKFVFLLVFAPALWGEVPWSLKLFIPGGRYTYDAHSGKNENWKVLGFAPAGRNRALVLWFRDVYRASKWTDWEKVKQEAKQRKVVDLPIETLEEEYVLGFVDYQGRILKRSGPHPELVGRRPGWGDEGSAPLVLEEVPECPYGLVTSLSPRLLCFDYQLQFMKKVELPLEILGHPHLGRQGNRPVLWCFGGDLVEGKEENLVQRKILSPPQASSKVAVGVALDTGELLPFPLSVQAILAAVEKVARDGAGNRCSIQPASLRVIPLEGSGEPLGLVVRGVCAKSFAQVGSFQGEELFFLTSVGEGGLGAVRQLPFWLRREVKSTNWAWDAKTQTLTMPEEGWLGEFRAFSLAPKELLLALQSYYTRGGGQKENSGKLTFSLFLVNANLSGMGEVSLFTEKDLREVVGVWEENELHVVKVLLGRMGKRLFGFLGMAAKDENSPQEGIAVLRLE